MITEDVIEVEDELAELVVSGYDWICSICQAENHLTSLTHNVLFEVIVTCPACGKHFATPEPDQAYD